METQNILSIVFTIAVIVGIFFTLSSSGVIKIEGITHKAEINIESKESFSKGEQAVFEVKAENFAGIKKMIYVSPYKTEEKTCNSQQCDAVFTETFKKTGLFFVEIRLELADNGKMTEKKKIQVIEGEKKCSDGTVFGYCSKEKPKYCNNGKLEENCIKCGCEQGTCIENKCLAEEALEIKEVYFAKKFVEPNEKTEIILEKEEGSQGQNEFTVQWVKEGKTEKTEKLNAELSSCIKCSLYANSPEKEGIYKLNFSFKEKVFSLGEVVVRNDVTAPAKPTGFIARKSNGKILLGWNSNNEDDLMEYLIYRSSEDTTAFTTYVYAKTVDKKETGTELEIMATNYFYLIAVDYYGNKSEPSEVIKAK
ncbi:hypothetical protein KKG83_05510 [Candidatus Micrarchaeota archaeon]|nr:hypothetical protein [Candidatus Micrarchaeota archaeon]MBU2476901.1 hypothetical protein [Candidatus Micrarchaeota archaeon]